MTRLLGERRASDRGARREPAGPEAQPLPAGFRVVLDTTAKELGPGLWFGGSPARVLRLTPAGATAWMRLRAHGVRTTTEGRLARRLIDAGLAHPVPPHARVGPSDVTILVPVLDRPDSLARCLGALGARHPVVVVDDGSADPAAVAAVAAAHGARLVRREINGGPAAARNTGLAAVRSEFVAFIDSDCVPPAGWLEPLVAHLIDPMLAAVAPRITGTADPTWAGRYTTARGNLDLGAAPSRVRPNARVSYVPTAALVARRAALLDVARSEYVFDPALRYGEDVDLVWRLDAAGWRVRYQPEARVTHHEPDRWPELLRRRFRYGTSAAPLSHAHPEAAVPLVVHPWPALAVAGTLARQPVVAALAYGASVATTVVTVRRADVPARGSATAMARAAHQTWLGAGRYSTQFAAPVLLAAAVLPGRSGRRVAALSLLLGGPLAQWWPRRRELDPARFVLGQLADEIAYGAGVWTGALRRRSVSPLRPRVAWRSLTPAQPRARTDEGVTR